MNNWQTKKLGEICEIKPPKNEARKKLKDDDLVSFVPMEDLGILNMTISLNKERKLKEASGSYTYFADGDVLLAKITPCFENGKLGIARDLKNGIGFGSSEYIVFRPNKNLIAEYLFYFLSNDEFRKDGKKNMSGAVGHKRVAKEFIENFIIPLPSLSEQKRIVKILDEVFVGIEKAKESAKKNLQNSSELFESYLQSVFVSPESNWEEKMLKEIGVVQTGSTPKTSNRSYFGNFIPFIKPADVDIAGNGEVRYTNDGLSENGMNVSRIIKEKSVLMVCIGATIGKVGFTIRDVTCNQQINALTPSAGLEPKLFYYILCTQKFFNDVLRKSSQATLPIINKSKWESIKVAYPKSPAEQKSIVTKLDALSEQTKKLEEIYKKKIADLDELKKSVLKKAFNGEL